MVYSKLSNPYTITQAMPTDVLPVELPSAKARLRIDTEDENADLKGLIAAASQHYEAHTGVALINRTVTAKFDEWPVGGEPIVLRPAPLVSVASVQYLDTGGATQTVAGSTYTVDTDSLTGLVWLAFDKTWPTLRSVARAITATYTAGHGTTPHDVPEIHQQAILLLVGHWYANRESVVVGTITSDVPQSYDAIVSTQRLPLWP